MDLLPFAISPWREPVCVAHQRLVIDGTVRSLTVPDGVQAASLEYEEGPVAIRLDTGVPDPAVDPIRFDRDRDTLARETARAWRGLRTGANDGAVRVTYYSWQR